MMSTHSLPAPSIRPSPRALSLFPGEPPEARNHGGASVTSESPLRGLLSVLRLLLDVHLAPLLPGSAASRVSRQLAVRQVFHAGVEGLPLVTVIGLIVGSSIALQLRALDDVLSEAVVGQLLASAMVREIAPLTTAIIVAARSGTTMVTEIGNMQANSEVLALRSMGIDIQRFLVWPRTVGAMVAVVVLAVYFGVVASVATSIVGGLGLGPNHGGVGAYAIRLGWPDLAVFFAKAWGLGGIVGLMCCHHGLSVDRSVHDVPVRASRAVVHTLAFCILYSVAISAASLALREAW